jgi:ubiquinone/menaquinone biosynthesis C-methylase UbiE
VVLDVGNGLAAAEPLIARTARPRRLAAVNITEWQLAAGRDRLREASAECYRVLRPGGVLSISDIFVVPKGTRHRPVAEQPAHGLMIEHPETLQYGN